MAYVIEIEGSIARLVDRVVVNEAPITALESALTVSKPFLSPRLPSGTDLATVFSYFDDSTREVKLLIERSPRTETIVLESNSTNEDGDPDISDEILEWHNIDEPGPLLGSHRLPVPWEYYSFEGTLSPNPTNPGRFIFVLGSSRLYWKPSRLRSFGEQLYVAKLPNVQSGMICWGDTNQGTSGELAEKIASMVLNFYNTPFNQDYGHMRLPMPINRFPITTDGLGIPDYDWSRLDPAYIGWATGPETVNLLHTQATIPLPDTVANTITPGLMDALPPETWQLDSVRNWYASLSPARRMYVDTLRDQNLVPA